MKFMIELNEHEFSEDMIESVDFGVLNERGSIRLMITVNGFISAKNEGLLNVARTATRDSSDGMCCKIYCTEDDGTTARQCEINKVYFHHYKEDYDTADGKGRFALTLHRARYNRADYMTDIMVFNQADL